MLVLRRHWSIIYVCLLYLTNKQIFEGCLDGFFDDKLEKYNDDVKEGKYPARLSREGTV